MLDLDRALGNASFNDRRFILIQGLIHDLNRKKTWHTRRCQFRVGRKARVMQPFEDQIRIHRIPARDLRDRYARRHRLKTDRPLLVVCPKPLRSTRHPKPRSVHYPWWTLSDPSTARQSGQAGRLPSIAAKGFFFDTVGVLSIGNNTLDPVSGTFSAWILEDTYSATDQAGLQFWGGTDFRWSFDTTCSTTSGCGGLPQLGTYTLALVPLPASLPMLLKRFAFDVNRKGIPKVLFV